MEEKLYPRRWAILIAMTIILVAIQFSFILPGGAAPAVMMTLGIDPMAFSMIMSIPYLSGFLFAILAGTLADRIGLNKVLIGGMVICLAGSIWRSLTGDSFEMVFASTFVMGFALAALNANSAKLLRIWFPGKANSFAMGVYTAGMSGGAALAIWFGGRVLIPGAPPESAWIDLAGAWWVCTAAIAIGTIVWICLYRNHPDGENQAKEPILQFLGTVLRNKDVWGVSIFAFLVFGMTNVNGSYMVAAITSLAGSGDPTIAANPDLIAGVQAQASDLSTLNTIITCIASMVLPAVFVSRFKHMRAPAAICLFGSAICFGVLYFLPWGAATWVLYIILGVVMASVMPITKMLPALLPSVKWEQLGAVGGVQATFQNAGMFLIATYILSPIATAMVPGLSDNAAATPIEYYQIIYVGVAVVCVLAFLSMFIFANVRSNMADKIADDHAANSMADKSFSDLREQVVEAELDSNQAGETPYL